MQVVSCEIAVTQTHLHTCLFHTSLMNFECSSMSAIATNDIELLDLLGLDKSDNFLQIKSPSGRSQKGSSDVMNVLHYLRRQNNGRQVGVIESLVSSPNTIDLAANAVEFVQRIGQFSDDIVESRTESSARDNGSIDSGGVKVQQLAGARSNVGPRAGLAILRFAHQICQNAFMVVANELVVLCSLGSRTTVLCFICRDSQRWK